MGNHSILCGCYVSLNYRYVYNTEARTWQYRRRLDATPVMAMSNEFNKQSMLNVSEECPPCTNRCFIRILITFESLTLFRLQQVHWLDHGWGCSCLPQLGIDGMWSSQLSILSTSCGMHSSTSDHVTKNASKTGQFIEKYGTWLIQHSSFEKAMILRMMTKITFLTILTCS
jgi:hypothetical protein